MCEATGLTELQDSFYQAPSPVTGMRRLAKGEAIVPMILRMPIDNCGIEESLESELADDSELADYCEMEDVIMEDRPEDWETVSDSSTTSSFGNILSSDSCISFESEEEDDTIDPDVRAARAETLAILTGEFVPPPNRDFSEYDPPLQRAFNLFREIDDLREQTLAHMRELEYLDFLRRRDAPLRYRNLAMFLHCNLWTRSPEPESAVLEPWGPEQQALLLEVEDEFGRVGRVRNLNACTEEEFEDVLSRMAERRFVDVIWVADREEYFPMRVLEVDLRAAVEVTLM
jgi:hypothetical protein